MFQILAAHKRISRLEAAYEASQQEKLELQQELAPATQRLLLMRGAYETLQQKKEVLQFDLISSQKHAVELKAYNDRLKQERAEILTEVESCKRRVAKSDIDLKETSKQLNVFKNKFDECNRQLNGSRDEVIKKQRKIEELQYKLEAIARENVQRDSFFEKLKQERRLFEEELKFVANDLEKANEEIRNLQQENDRLMEENKNILERLLSIEGVAQQVTRFCLNSHN